MTIHERDRHQMYTRLEEVLGTEHASTLMSHLPPTGWGDVATTGQLSALEERLVTRISESHTSLVRLMLSTVVASNATMAAVIITVLG
jgi:hypothetical protein